MDEAAAKLRMEVDSVPEELDEISRKIKQLEIEREAIKRENDRPKLEQIGKELAELKEQEKSYKAKWQSEKTLVNKIQQNKIEIENLKFEADKAEREGDYGKVAEIRYGKLQALNQEIEETQQKLHEMQGDKAMIKEEVDAEDIADVVSRWTGIPVSKMLQSEKDKLLHLEDELHQRVIGQDEAVHLVAQAMKEELPVPAFSSALNYFYSLVSAKLPANMIQAQRDYFGAHTFERTDELRGQFFHENWTGHGGDTKSGTYNV